MSKRRVIIAIAISLTLAFGIPLNAQHRRKRAVGSGENVDREQAQKARQTKDPNVPYLSGEAKVTVRGEEHPVIRIGMAPSGITIIEFPATDRFFAVHPPENGDWVQVEKSPSLKTDHHLVLRAGKDLVKTGGPAASVSVQMRSGLIVTIWVYPVKMIPQQTYRCVISYDRAEIVASRRSAGLAVNLGEESSEKPSEKAEKTEKVAEEFGEKSVGETEAAQTGVNESAAKAPVTPVEKAEKIEKSEPSPAAEPPLPSVIANVEKSNGKKLAEKGDRRAQAKCLIEEAVAKPKQFKKWTEPLHGLIVSAQSHDFDERTKIAVIAVKNVQSEAIRVLPGHPDLYIETLDGKEKTFQISPVRKFHTDSTTTSSIIPAGATVYYAVVYAAPVLGVKQRLRVAVGQTNAADDPAATGLSARQ
jgi:hypothetical protein